MLPRSQSKSLDAALFYQESGVVPAWAMHVTLLAGLVAAFVVPPVAVVVCNWILSTSTWQYLILLLSVPLVHGYFICSMVLLTAAHCHVRSRRFLLGICLVCLPLGFYFFLHALTWSYGNVGGTSFLALLNPWVLWQTLAPDLAKNPPWLNWIVVGAALVEFVLYMLGLTALPICRRPYCEKCQRLCKSHRDLLHFDQLSPQRLEQGDFEEFREPCLPNDELGTWQARLYHCPECVTANYLRLWRVQRHPRKRYHREIVLHYNLLAAPAKLKECFDEPCELAE